MRSIRLKIGYLLFGAMLCVFRPDAYAVTMQVSPLSVVLGGGQTAQFLAAVSGVPVTPVVWAVNGTIGGNATVGTISATGFYTAPANIVSQSTVTIVASGAGTFAKAYVTLVPVSVTVSPATATLGPSKSQRFTASVAGSTNTSVTWTLSPAIGTLSGTGLYTSPGSIASQQIVTVTATSVANTSKTAAAIVTLAPPLSITTASLSGGTTGAGYSVNLAATGGVAPYVWSVVTGMLPPGLRLSSSGAISGTPSMAGTYSVTIQARDTLGMLASKSYSISIVASSGVTWGPTFYVSGTQGNDSWSGLLAAPNSSYTDGPFQTLAKAQSAMQTSATVKAATLRGGSYPVASAWQFNWADSGELWISYPGETAILDGGGTGSVQLSGVNHWRIEGLTIQRMGPAGLYLTGGSTAITIRWNNFYTCTNRCIGGSGVTNSVIDSNTIDGQSPGNPPGDTGNAYSAIMLWYGSSNNQITHNLIRNCQGGGINFSAGAGDLPNNGNLIDRNVLQNVNTNVTDSGAIYLMDRTHLATGNQVTNNIINGNGGTNYLTNQTKAIYLDDLMSNVLVSGNVCRNCGQYAWQTHAGDHNTIANNIFDLSSAGTLAGLYQNNPLYPDYGMAGNVIQRNIFYFSGAAPSSLYQVILGGSDALPGDSSNLYYSAAGASIPNGVAIIDASPVYGNPQFADAASGNYAMPVSALAYTAIAFQPLPADQGPLPYSPQ